MVWAGLDSWRQLYTMKVLGKYFGLNNYLVKLSLFLLLDRCGLLFLVISFVSFGGEVIFFIGNFVNQYDGVDIVSPDRGE